MNENLRLLIKQAQAATPRNEQERLVFQWLPLIHHVAERLHVRLCDDKLTIALDALMHAAELFDPARGVQFNTYAYTAIYRELIRPPRLKQVVFQPLRSLPQETQGPAAGDPLVRREERRRCCQRARRLLARMRPRDRQVVLAVAVGGLSKKQVGQELGIGKERARQLYERGIREARRGARLAAADVA